MVTAFFPQASLSFTIFWHLFKLMSIESVTPSNHLYPLSPPSPPALSLSQHSSQARPDVAGDPTTQHYVHCPPCCSLDPETPRILLGILTTGWHPMLSRSLRLESTSKKMPRWPFSRGSLRMAALASTTST